MRPFLALVVLVTGFLPFTFARDDSPTALETALQATRFKYQKTEEGDYRLQLNWTNEKRGQSVIVRKRSVSLQDGISVRELCSYAWRGKERPDAAVMEALLKDHPDLGAWQLAKDEDGWGVYLHTDLPDDLRPAAFKRWIVIIAEEADQMEKKLVGKSDTF